MLRLDCNIAAGSIARIESNKEVINIEIAKSSDSVMFKYIAEYCTCKCKND